MIDDFKIKIKDLVDTQLRGDSITLLEKKNFDYDISSLRDVTSRLVNGKLVSLTTEQYFFVKKLLGFCITSNMPRLEGVLAVFDLGLEDTLCNDE